VSIDDGAFQWDDAKAATNLAKHGITFEMAREAFKDPFILEWSDDSQTADEPRFAALAMVEQRVLFVAYAIRGEAIRVISARRAEAFERRRYADDNRT
ncbi:BrnT family toxin, partial [Methylobacterium trifolii]|uniref:BrnT family toxin n=1 Tax=Methylobacterium trifolii TaxID=1003092 RepID=UPI001EDE3AA0